MTLQLTARDAATLVAALHAWQNELSYHTVEELADRYNVALEAILSVILRERQAR